VDKSYFCFLLEWAEMFNLLTEAQCGALIKAMIAYEKDGTEPAFTDDILRFAWLSNIKPKMDTIQEHYNEKVGKLSKAGKASAEKRKQRKQMLEEVEQNQQMLTNVENVEHSEQMATNNNYNLNNNLIEKENTLKEKEHFSECGMEVIKLYEERFGIISSFKAMQLNDLVTDFGKDAVAYAVRQANISSAPGINYIRTTAMNFVRRKEDGKVAPTTNTTKFYGGGIVV